MTEAKSKKGLGKGLSALLPGLDNDKQSEEKEQVMFIKTEYLFANPAQPRKIFDAEKLAELSDSIKEHGMVQPLVVIKKKDKQYMIVAGERRYRAAKEAGLKEIPCMVRDLTEAQITEIALIENIQRENLNAWEEAQSYRDLQQKFGYTQEQLAQKLGKSRPYVANILRLLSLDDYCAELLKNNQISAGHARALLSVESEYNRRALAGRILREQLSVRDTEQLAKNYGKISVKAKHQKAKKTSAHAAVEKQLCYKLGTKVAIEAKENGGRIIIEYYSDEDLTRLADLLLPQEEI